jgi:periplasmic divalent cation tolerance protein
MSQQTTPYRVVLMTTASDDEAARLAQALVSEGLAACVNIAGPVRSIYRWQGKVEDAAEHLLIAKTRDDLLPALAERVRALHSYEVPEVLALPVLYGWPPYLAWVGEETRSTAGA